MTKERPKSSGIGKEKRLDWVKLNLKGSTTNYIKPTIYSVDWGRHGFDVGNDAERACRGAEHLVNTAANNI